jgi:hypothetical protein
MKPRAFMPHRTLQKDGTVVEGFAEREVVDALHGPTGNKEPLIVQPSAASSPASAGSTTGSPEQAGSTPSSASPTPTDATCCERAGPECRCTRTCETWAIQSTLIGRSDEAGPQGMGFSREAFYTLDKSGPPGVLISSPAASPAKTFPSPDGAPGSPENAADCSTSSPESRLCYCPSGSLLRTYLGF